MKYSKMLSAINFWEKKKLFKKTQEVSNVWTGKLDLQSSAALQGLGEKLEQIRMGALFTLWSISKVLRHTKDHSAVSGISF